jgi:hypothetical protein
MPLSPTQFVERWRIASLTRITRRTVKLRSVTSCISPMVHSRCRSSTTSARTFSVVVSSFFSSGVTSGGVYGTLRTPPSVTTWIFGGLASFAAGVCPQAATLPIVPAQTNHRNRMAAPYTRAPASGTAKSTKGPQFPDLELSRQLRTTAVHRR